ncbi:hypothetical protein LR48_Vigan635s002100 [Vigna angularis]|uniref:Uncharacterized protein n=2 Tax=Phaseolus angularis TaxID=3914 RepID=A0A0L9TF99_PHAAN|nr:GDSL esterase/lipase 1 isoform X1 [Vigna angularis]KOM29096.1 hypothetical protein LR48_Vigan635s002100 [Vigna angularis]BAT80399.1 hypothetical protein VIGAN_02340800 [Vigna angularis var. angularis]
MASSNFSFCFLVSLATYGISCCLSLGDDVCQPKEHAALFVFGDSLFDVGNNNYINTTADYQANYSPYGETFFKYPTGRFSDGRVLPDFIAEYANLPLIPPYLFPGNHRYVDGVNFASAGARALVQTHQGLVIDLKTQLSYFRKVSKELRQQLGNAETTALLAKAVYLINIGINDYEISLSKNSSNSRTDEKHVEMVVGNLTSVIKGIHEAGGRKFGVFSLPAAGCVPYVKGLVNGSKGSCVEEASALPKLHNSVLYLELGKLKKELEGFKYSYVDYFTITFDVINNPSKYGLKEGDVACCGSGPHRGYNSCGGRREVKDYELCENPKEYVFFDSLHPTQSAHQIVSQLVWSGNQSIAGPYNLRSLFQP